jgi:hypothetical protein
VDKVLTVTAHDDGVSVCEVCGPRSVTRPFNCCEQSNEPTSTPADTEDRDQDAGEVEPDEADPVKHLRWYWDDRRNVPICDQHHRKGDLPYAPIPDEGRHPRCYECYDTERKWWTDDHGELSAEPNERVRITIQYPDHPTKLLQVRYGTLSRVLAEAFNGRPWGQS